MKLKCFVVIISFLFLFTSCGIKADSQEKQANLILDELIIALENEDTSAIKEMFAEDVQNSIDLDTQIEEMLEYFDGKVISYEKIGTVAGGESYDNGKLTFSRIDHYFVDKELSMPMTLSLYNYNNKDNIDCIYNWAPTPDNPQWWITGFNPEYVGKVDVTKYVMIGTVDFSGNEEMYDRLKETGDDTILEYYNKATETYLIFDDQNKTGWVCWYEEELVK